MFEARDQNFRARVRDSFARQSFMRTLGAALTDVRPGFVEIRLDYAEGLCQQHGYFHGGVIGALADNAGGYAAFTLMGAADSVLTVEYKVNLVAPGRGERLVAHGEVLRAGRTLSVCQARVLAESAGERHLCATALCTLMTLANRADGPPADVRAPGV